MEWNDKIQSHHSISETDTLVAFGYSGRYIVSLSSSCNKTPAQVYGGVRRREEPGSKGHGEDYMQISVATK